jgi:hypothetical protein
VGGANVSEMIGDNPAAGVAEDVADEKKLHAWEVTAPSDADPTSATYLANTPVL